MSFTATFESCRCSSLNPGTCPFRDGGEFEYAANVLGADRESGPNAAMEIMMTNIMNPHSLMQDDLPLSSPLNSTSNSTSNSTPSYQEILDRSLHHLSDLLQEGISLPDYENRNYLADQVEQQLLSLIPRLREGGQSQHFPTSLEAIPTSIHLYERYSLLSPSFGMHFIASWPSTLPSTGGYSSETSPGETSTQTGSTSIFNITDRPKSDNKLSHCCLAPQARC
jgi:hypothetical protein